MGMNSEFLEQDIEVLDKKGILSLRDDKNNFHLVDRDGEIDFQEWDSHKLYGYWYKDTVLFLQQLAKYIKGTAMFRYEEGNIFRLVFEDGKVYLQSQEPVFEWDKIEKIEVTY